MSVEFSMILNKYFVGFTLFELKMKPLIVEVLIHPKCSFSVFAPQPPFLFFVFAPQPPLPFLCFCPPNPAKRD
jgi:hypothetical protein